MANRCESPISAAVAEYNNPPTPELVTRIFQAIWQAREKLANGVKFEVTPCSFSQDELTRFERENRGVSYLPESCATQGNRYVLGTVFPKMEHGSLRRNNIFPNSNSPSGWFDYEKSIKAPYLRIMENEFSDRLFRKGMKLLSLNQYAVAGQDSKLFREQYLDEEDTWTYVNSCIGGNLAQARFNPDGAFSVIWNLYSWDSSSVVGVRSSETKIDLASKL